MARRMSPLSLAMAALVGSGCAAMQRTWAFDVAAIAGPEVQVKATEANVTQKDVWLTIQVENVSGRPLDVSFETFVLTLPDGEQVDGYVNYMDRRMSDLTDTFNSVRGKDTGDPPLQPGGHVEVQLNFHQYGRDLRRLHTLTVDLAGLLVDGSSTTLAPLVLEAPPEAPLGEHL